jgi:hypothetical protein
MTDGPAAPALASVRLECQPQGVHVLAVVTDPQGSSNLMQIPQTIAVFTNDNCQGPPLALQAEFPASGAEVDFGEAVAADANPGLVEAICGCDIWPVEATLTDSDDNTTSGVVAASVVVP